MLTGPCIDNLQETRWTDELAQEIIDNLSRHYPNEPDCFQFAVRIPIGTEEEQMRATRAMYSLLASGVMMILAQSARKEYTVYCFSRCYNGCELTAVDQEDAWEMAFQLHQHILERMLQSDEEKIPLHAHWYAPLDFTLNVQEIIARQLKMNHMDYREYIVHASAFDQFEKLTKLNEEFSRNSLIILPFLNTEGKPAAIMTAILSVIPPYSISSTSFPLVYSEEQLESFVNKSRCAPATLPRDDDPRYTHTAFDALIVSSVTDNLEKDYEYGFDMRFYLPIDTEEGKQDACRILQRVYESGIPFIVGPATDKAFAIWLIGPQVDFEYKADLDIVGEWISYIFAGYTHPDKERITYATALLRPYLQRVIANQSSIRKPIKTICCIDPDSAQGCRSQLMDFQQSVIGYLKSEGITADKLDCTFINPFDQPENFSLVAELNQRKSPTMIIPGDYDNKGLRFALSFSFEGPEPWIDFPQDVSEEQAVITPNTNDAAAITKIEPEIERPVIKTVAEITEYIAEECEYLRGFDVYIPLPIGTLQEKYDSYNVLQRIYESGIPFFFGSSASDRYFAWLCCPGYASHDISKRYLVQSWLNYIWDGCSSDFMQNELYHISNTWVEGLKNCAGSLKPTTPVQIPVQIGSDPDSGGMSAAACTFRNNVIDYCDFRDITWRKTEFPEPSFGSFLSFLAWFNQSQNLKLIIPVKSRDDHRLRCLNIYDTEEHYLQPFPEVVAVPQTTTQTECINCHSDLPFTEQTESVSEQFQDMINLRRALDPMAQLVQKWTYRAGCANEQPSMEIKLQNGSVLRVTACTNTEAIRGLG